MNYGTIIRTSSKEWLEKSLKAYTERKKFTFIDDANYGYEVKDLSSFITLISTAKKNSGIPWNQIVKGLSNIGIAGVGIWMIAIAMAEVEPTSKLSLLIGGGILMALTGSIGLLASPVVKLRYQQQHQWELLQ